MLKIFRMTREKYLTVAAMVGVISLGLVVRLVMPITDKSIGEIDVYFWALRTQEYLLQGWAGIGTSFWVVPVVMGNLHRLIGGTLYDLFLWSGSFISGVLPPIATYLLTKEITRSKVASVLAALAMAINPLILYRSVFTVSETFAYVLIPWTLYFAVLLIRKKSYVYYLVLVAVLLLAMQTHDSAKLLVLPVGLSTLYYFWSQKKEKSTWLMIILTLIGGSVLLLKDKSIISGIRFFLWPTNTGNTAFGKYLPLTYEEYFGVAAGLLSIFSIAGVLFSLFWKRIKIIKIAILLTFIIPILYYQQIQPRISDSTIVPFRLTVYLVFIAAPLLGVAISGWLHVAHDNRKTRYTVILFSLLFVIIQISPAKYPLSYVTGMEEQKSLVKLPVTSQDYLITQTSMIGMTSVATKTNESNYFGDTSNQIFRAQNVKDIHRELDNFIVAGNKRPTGVLISKWKIVNRDPYYGWWDSLVNPTLNIQIWKNTGWPIRYEDANILILNLPKDI